MSQQWAGKTTAYRLYCQGCDAETVVHAGSIDDSDWRVTSLHFHEGECPACARGVVEQGGEPQAAADGGVERAYHPCVDCGREIPAVSERCADCLNGGGQPTLEAFAGDAEVRD